MIGPYEAPLFAKNGWLTNLSKQYIASDPGYDAGDLLPPIAKALSYKGDLYAVPFYGESSMMFYNKTLFQQAGLTMPHNPTWAQIQGFAAKLNQPGKVAGICLRGLAGWGDNMAALDTVVNTFGGQWFDMNWKPQLTSPPFVEATNFYVNLVRKYGEPGASNDSFNQLLTLYGQGKCAMWYDATVAATSIATTYPDVYKQTGYALAPVNKTKSSGWLWTWALGIPQGVSNSGAAWKFVSWATSKQYDQLVASKYGWAAVPPGTRTSLYNNPEYQKAAKPFAGITLESINSDRPGAPDPEPGALRRHPVRRHPAVREPRLDGRPADRGGDRRHGEREPGAAGRSVRRVAVHPGATVRRLARTVSRALWRGPAHRARPVVARRKKGVSVTVLEDLAPPPKVEVKPRGVSRRERWQLRLPLLPALIYTIVVTQIPFLVTLWYSFQSYFWNTPAPASFNGLANYKTVFTNPAFRGSLVRSVVMTVTAVIVAMILGVFFAVLLDRKFLGRSVVRTLMITPFLVMPVAAALVWAGPMLDPQFGLVNYLLQPFGVHHVAWLSTHALGSVILVMIWQWTPFMMLIVLAGLQSQPSDTLEAAKVDGAGAFATFRELTFPHLRPYIELGVLLGSIYLVNTFDAVKAMTQGGPGTSTTNLPYYLYQQVNNAFDIGGAAATGVVTVILTIIVATFALRMFARVFQFEEA